MPPQEEVGSVARSAVIVPDQHWAVAAAAETVADYLARAATVFGLDLK